MIDHATLHHLRTDVLDLAYEESGPAEGEPVLLMHGFPQDPRSYDGVVPRLVAAGMRCIVPYLRGYGPTRFLIPETPRSGQQGALAHDLLQLIDGLGIARAVIGGYDWGGRAACIVAALWPERVKGLVSCAGYNIQDIAANAAPWEPIDEHRFWYQWYFHTERGRAGLAAHRAAFCKLLWRLWSPSWDFDEADYAETATSFDNPDFVDVVIQSYRHRYANAPGDPAYDAIEARLADTPPIAVPTINLHGADDQVIPAWTTEGHAARFSGTYELRRLDGIGHNVPQEAPAAFAAAILEMSD
ncbi:MAG: alpha/beta hydrolase [Alphaproteobacteria bacterium]|jgi:pimeloyl-ACP methyl ester carboxylesterase|nr:alpha/beta hydrolase [Alphaproteobacteria bacterium]